MLRADPIIFYLLPLYGKTFPPPNTYNNVCFPIGLVLAREEGDTGALVRCGSFTAIGDSPDDDMKWFEQLGRDFANGPESERSGIPFLDDGTGRLLVRIV
ncbi:hypothetical protein VTL71DRAFT_5217 [Oculimacula yallundae]|uniref:Uncharacterized protein n=1 Tax=Oculimacula yallundae TaxID=86028 RepID=A0ABR4C0J6_9HELO